MKVPKFLKDRWFYISIGIIIILIVSAFEITFHSLDSFTRHGEELVVPDLTAKDYKDVRTEYSDVFNFQLIDSIYIKNFPEGAVYQQDPKPGAKVKKGRNMYIIMTSVAPEIVRMPNLRNLSLRQAMVSLGSVGLRVETLVFVDYFARNAVVDQLVSGEVVEPETELVKGTAVTLHVGMGKGDMTTHLPDLVAADKFSVKERINGASLNLGSEIFIDDDEPENLVVWRMEPEYDINTLVPLGSNVNVWYKSVKNFDVEWYRREQFLRDSIVEKLRLKKTEPEIIKYILDSFNYILSHRSFSFDEAQRERDMGLIFTPVADIDSLRFDDNDSLYFNDNETDTILYYDE